MRMFSGKRSKKSRQSGFAVGQAILAMLLAGGIGTVAYNGYFMVVKGSAATSKRMLSDDFLTQAGYLLAVEASDSDADGFNEAPEVLASGTAPTGGGIIPTTSGAPKVDAWGSNIGYCSWDHGTDNVSAGRITGSNPGSLASVVFAVISAGPDKIFDTTCANVASGAGAQGDDGVRYATAGQILQGVGGTVYYGDPVADATALAALDTTNTQDGEVRLTLDDNAFHRWNGGLGAWEDVSGGASGVWTDEGDWISYTDAANGAVVATGTHGTGSAPVSGAGTRMMWLPHKSAFRVGRSTGTEWDEANIGNYSFATGNSNRASGENAVSFGISNISSGTSSFTSGQSNTASGQYAHAMGDQNTASSRAAIAIGWLNTASTNNNAMALGYNNAVSGNTSYALGNQNTAAGTNNFMIGTLNSSAGAANNGAILIGRSNSAANAASYAYAMGQDNAMNAANGGAFGHFLSSDAQHAYVFGRGFDATNRLTNATANSLAFGVMSSALDTVPELMIQDGGAILNGTTLVESLTNNGRIALAETTSPAATAGYGKLYVSSLDSSLYYMDDLGVEYNLLTAGGVTSSGSANYIPKFISESEIGDSVIYEDGSGRIGIGTTTPANQLHVYSGAGSVNVRAQTADTTSGVWSVFNVNVPTAAASYGVVEQGSAAASYGFIGTGTLSPFLFRINNLEVGRFDTDGDLGIGTTAPDTAIDVYRASGAAQGRFWSAGASGNSQLQVRTDSVNLIAGALETGTYGYVGTSTNHTLVLRTNSADRIHIGNTAQNGNVRVLNGAFYATGTHGTGATPISGAGARMMWLPHKSAFRAGVVVGDRWDEANIGEYSAAFGYDTRVSGHKSFAAGDVVIVDGSQSAGFGYNVSVSGTRSFGAGIGTVVSGGRAFGFGREVTAGAEDSYVFGRGFDSTSNRLVNNVDQSFMVGFMASAGDTDPEFMVREGGVIINGRTLVESLTNNGRLALAETTAPAATAGYGKLYVKSADSQLYFLDGSGTEYNLSTATSAWTNHNSWIEYSSVTGGAIVASGTHGTGSTPVSGTGTRMMWLPHKSAFRAGAVVDDYWNEANIGEYSAAFGYKTRVSGDWSFAAGDNVRVDGSQSAGFGYNVSVSGTRSFGAGIGTVVSGGRAFGFGSEVTASGQNSYIFGYGFDYVNRLVNNVDQSFMVGFMASAGDTTPELMVREGGAIINGTTLVEALTNNGRLALAETTAPTATAGYGKLYVNSADSQLYFMDDGGVEYNLSASVSPWTNNGSWIEYSSVTGGAVVASGTHGTGSTPVSGAGTRMMWLPHRSAFRAGAVSGDQWDEANIGEYSAAFGYSSRVSGDRSFAAGDWVNVSGSQSAGFGYVVSVSGLRSFGAGVGTVVSGATSFGFGSEVTAGAEDSYVFGRGFDSTSNRLVNNVDQSFMVGFMASAGDTDPEFMVREGGVIINGRTLVESLTNNGRLALAETTAPAATAGYGKLYVKSADSQLYFLDSSGVEYNLSASVSPWTNHGSWIEFSSVTGGAIVASGTHGTGSTPVSGAGTRMMWLPHRSAFRAGAVSGDQWDEVNIGEYSAAFGYNAKASGGSSFAAGDWVDVSGGQSAGFGYSISVSGLRSFGAGVGTVVSGATSFGFGREVTAGAEDSYIFGRGFDGANKLINNVDRSFMVGFMASVGDTTPEFSVREGVVLVNVASPAITNGLEIGAGGVILARGTHGVGSTPVSGGGTRFMWLPHKSAIRAGHVWGGEWNEASIGNYSAAFGRNSAVSADYGFAAGDANAVSGGYGAAFGQNNQIASSSGHSLVAGVGNIVSGAKGIVFGSENRADGGHTFIAGDYLRTGHDYTTIFGRGFDDANRLVNNTENSFMVGYMNASGDTSPELFVQDGAVVMGGTAPQAGYYLTVYGSAYASGGTWDPSDIRFKKNVEDVNNALALIKGVRAVRYNYKSEEFKDKNFSKDRKIGFIAQELIDLFPELVKKDASGYLAVDYSSMTPVLARGIQEQQIIIESIDDRLKRAEQGIEFAQNPFKSDESVAIGAVGSVTEKSLMERGTSSMGIGGVAEIDLPPTFSGLTKSHTMSAYLTPEITEVPVTLAYEISDGKLIVRDTAKTGQKINFSWMVVAERADVNLQTVKAPTYTNVSDFYETPKW